ncbi:MAG: tyrosine-type recombinase/integrase [Pseudomonadales bacterium]|nr:tyrosine-type recombinase/integrase [Pseudomonadales bacterium]
MPRKRRTDLGLPPRVYRKDSGAYSYHPPSGGSQKIAGKKATMSEVWDAYNHLVKSANFTSLEYFAEQYYRSNNFQTLSPRTQSDYRECGQRPIKAFEGFNCHRMEPAHITAYLKRRFEKAKRRTNLELTWFKNVFGNACGAGLYNKRNPTVDIKPFRISKEQKAINKAKKRYVSDEDYDAMYEVLPLVGRIAMEIAYCTGIRPGDVLSLRTQNIKTDVLQIEENKTGQEYNKEISPRLKRALDASKDIPGQRFGGWIIRNRHGNRYTDKGWQAIWKRWKKKLSKHQQFTFSELRHKAITDAKNDKQKFSMHKDARMLSVYDHEKPTSPTHS